jgi:hypothetical protein
MDSYSNEGKIKTSMLWSIISRSNLVVIATTATTSHGAALLKVLEAQLGLPAHIA